MFVAGWCSLLFVVVCCSLLFTNTVVCGCLLLLLFTMTLVTATWVKECLWLVVVRCCLWLFNNHNHNNNNNNNNNHQNNNHDHNNTNMCVCGCLLFCVVYNDSCNSNGPHNNSCLWLFVGLCCLQSQSQLQQPWVKHYRTIYQQQH